MTLAEGTCGNCGKSGPLAEVHVYLNAPGSVLRCSSCGQVLITIVRAREEVWLNLGGIRRLRFEVSAE